MSGEVRKLHELDAPEKAPALGMSLQVDLGAGRVCTLQTFVDSTVPVGELDAMLDKMTSAGDRQRAHYKIEELERDLDKTEREQAQHKDDLATIDQRHAENREKLRAEAQALQGSVDTFMATARDTHVARGGRTEFQLKGGDKSNVTKIENAVGKLKDEMAKAEAEHAVAHANSDITFKRREEIIARLKDEIARCRAIVARKG